MKHSSSSPDGFALLGLLILLAVIEMATSATVALGVVVQRRSAEAALLDIGHEFEAALQSYASATPTGQSPYPASLQDLLKDPRVAGVRRHLRQIYVDPLTGRAEWGVILALPSTSSAALIGPGIAGVISLSVAHPIKQDSFDAEFAGFEHRSSYADWQFKADRAPIR